MSCVSGLRKSALTPLLFDLNHGGGIHNWAMGSIGSFHSIKLKFEYLDIVGMLRENNLI